MQIQTIEVTQRKLRNPDQIADMMEAIAEGIGLPPILLSRTEANTVQIWDGHHRLVAIWLTGQRELAWGECVIIESEQSRPTFGNVEDLIRRCGIFA